LNFDFLTGIATAINSQYYEKLRERVNNLIYYLSMCIESLDDIDGVLVNNYNIDDNLVNNVSVNSLKDDLKNRVSYLKNTIIPSINSKINS